MRKIKGSLPEELKNFYKDIPVARGDSYPISQYSDLVRLIAKLSFLNKDYLIFYRGQGKDIRNKAGSSSFYPNIYRDDNLQRREINYRFDLLYEAARQLKNLFTELKVTGYRELRRKKYIQWSILQHYGVSKTPLLDLTHSIRVACSFAQHFSYNKDAYVYVFGLPYVTNRISINSEHDIVNVRLLSISPPDALRPHFQEGYLVGTEDITNEYDSKSELDFKNRLLAKFVIPSTSKFWDSNLSIIPEELLFPENDRVGELCKDISLKVEQEIQPGLLGEFLHAWTKLEDTILSNARNIEPLIYSLSSAIDLLVETGLVQYTSLLTFHEIRKFRNIVVHEPKKINEDELVDYINRIRLFEENAILSNI